MRNSGPGPAGSPIVQVVALRLPDAAGRRLFAASALCALLMLLPALHSPAGAAAAVSAYTLSQAFADALARDVRVQAAQGRVRQAQESRAEVLGERWPTLSATGNAGWSYDRNEARSIVTYEGRSVHGGLQLSQNLHTFGRLDGRLRRAGAEIAEAEHMALAVRHDVLAEVARSFVEQVVYGQILDRRLAFEMLVGDLERLARERVDLGTLDRTELHEIRRRHLQARAERIAAGSHARTSSMRLARLTGAYREDLDAGSLADLAAAVPTSLDEALARAERESPTLAQARARVEAVEGELAFRKADLLPSLTLEISAGSGRVVDIESFDVAGSVQLRIPLYEGGRKGARLAVARSAVATARHGATAERELAGIQVRSGWETIGSLQRAQEQYQAAIAEAQTVVDLTRIKLDAGRATYVHYIEARRAVLEAEFDHLDNRLALDISRIELLRTLGALR